MPEQYVTRYEAAVAYLSTTLSTIQGITDDSDCDELDEHDPDDPDKDLTASESPEADRLARLTLSVRTFMNHVVSRPGPPSPRQRRQHRRPRSAQGRRSFVSFTPLAGTSDPAAPSEPLKAEHDTCDATSFSSEEGFAEATDGAGLAAAAAERFKKREIRVRDARTTGCVGVLTVTWARSSAVPGAHGRSWLCALPELRDAAMASLLMGAKPGDWARTVDGGYPADAVHARLVVVYHLWRLARSGAGVVHNLCGLGGGVAALAQALGEEENEEGEEEGLEMALERLEVVMAWLVRLEGSVLRVFLSASDITSAVVDAALGAATTSAVEVLFSDCMAVLLGEVSQGAARFSASVGRGVDACRVCFESVEALGSRGEGVRARMGVVRTCAEEVVRRWGGEETALAGVARVVVMRQNRLGGERSWSMRVEMGNKQDMASYA